MLNYVFKKKITIVSSYFLQDKIHAQLSWAWKMFYNLGA